MSASLGVFFFFFFFWVTGELSTLRQLMKVPNEPGLSPNNGLGNMSLSDQSMASNPRKGQVKCHFVFFFWGYRGIVHPPSTDEGTERTWFEPEQRPRKRVPKRSVHGKQSPQGASKMSWRQDDQPCGRAGHVMTHMCHPSKARRMASVTIQVPMQGVCTQATVIALWPAKLPSQAMSS